MNIPPYWVRERRLICGKQVRLRGISVHSQQDAEARLAERARLWQEFLALPPSQADALRFQESLRQLDGLTDKNETPKIKKFFENLKDFFD